MTSSLAESPLSLRGLLASSLRGVAVAGLSSSGLRPPGRSECGEAVPGPERGVADAGPDRGVPAAGLECSLRGPAERGSECGEAVAGPERGSERGVAEAGPDLGVVVAGGALPDGVVSAGRPVSDAARDSLFTGVEDIGGALPDGVRSLRSPLRAPDMLRGLELLRGFFTPSEAMLGTGDVGVRFALRMLRAAEALRGLDALRGLEALRSPEAVRGLDALRGLDVLALRVLGTLVASSSSLSSS